jgi:hypothetical protein
MELESNKELKIYTKINSCIYMGEKFSPKQNHRNHRPFDFKIPGNGLKRPAITSLLILLNN